MKVYTLTREQSVSRPLDEVFGFFSRPENLARLTPDSLGFIVLTPSPIEMKAGAVIDYTIRVLGFRRHWRTLIESYDPPHRFVDIQLKGPYILWHHTHSFSKTGTGTLIRDDVRFVLPLGVLGRLAYSLLIKRQLDRIFKYRSKVISEVFG